MAASGTVRRPRIAGRASRGLSGQWNLSMDHRSLPWTGSHLYVAAECLYPVAQVDQPVARPDDAPIEADTIVGNTELEDSAFLLSSIVALAPWPGCLVAFCSASATVLFVMVRREQGRRLFSPGEFVILAVSSAGAIVGVVALAAGWISI